MKKIFFILFGLIVLVSCQKNINISFKEVFENNVWNKFRTLDFTFEMIQGVEYQTIIRIEYLPKYEYSDLKIQYELISPDGETKLNYFTIPTTDEKGKSLGKPLNGHLVTEMVVSKKDFINSVGKYKILIDNVMPKFDTENIVSIEVILESL